MRNPTNDAPARTRRLVLTVAAATVLLAGSARGQDEGSGAGGRDFPKTLTLDEPGIDDEASLPTLAHSRDAATGRSQAAIRTDVTVEIDKRLTDRLDVQLNGGWTDDALADGRHADGWQTFALTTKYVAFEQPATQTVVTLGAARGFGGSGAARIGAARTGETTPTLYFGQGFGAAPLPAALLPFALTGTLGYLLPDRTRVGAAGGEPQQLQVGLSLQYDLHVLAPWIEAAGWPAAASRLIPIVEFTYDLPTTAAGGDGRAGAVAPGLIYVGDGYQLAAEALVPVTRAAGSGVGFVAQLNLSFRTIGLDRLARPLF